MSLLHVTATVEGRGTMIDVVERVAKTVFIPFHGRRLAPGEVSDFTTLLRAGADKVSVNSSAVRRPALISEAAEKFGSQCVVCAIDAKRRGDSFEVYLDGGRTPTGIDAVEWAQHAHRLGAGRFCSPAWMRTGKNRDTIWN